MNPSPSPNFALLTGLDMSSFPTRAGTRGATNIDVTWSSSYEDAISMLNGRGMATGLDLSAQCLTSSNFGTDWHIGIDADDKLEVSCDIAFRIKFNSSSGLTGLTDVFGIGTTFVNSSGASILGPTLANAATAPSDWLRGEIISFSYTIEQTSGGSNTFTFNFSGSAQDLIVACRVRGNADIDDGSNSLEAADVAATSGDSRWYVNNDGHVVNSSLGLSAWTWNASDKTLRNFLGFTGNETTTTVNGYTVLTADNPCSGVLVPSRPYQQNHISVENVAQSRRKIGGGYTSNYIGTYRDNVLGFDLDARLDQVDLYQHFIHNFVPLCSQGERVNFYQVWGDSRRSLITADANADQPAHDLVYTSSRNGFEGRIRGSMKSNEYNLMFPNNMRRRVPVNMRIEHLNE
jgi:hypothetical protein